MSRFTTKVALRYLNASRESRYFSWIAALSILGVSISIAAMIVVISVVNGFEKELRVRFLGANAHVLLYRYPAGVLEHEKWENKILQDYKSEISGTSPFLHAETLIRNEGHLNSVLVKGIHPKKRHQVQPVDSFITPTNALTLLQTEIDSHVRGEKLVEVPSIILGKGLLSLIQAKIGDTIHIISPPKQEISNEFKTFKIVGTYDSGLTHYDNKIALVSIPAGQQLLGTPQLVTGIEIGLKDPEVSDLVAEKMLAQYPFSVKQWKSYNEDIFRTMKQEKIRITFLVWLIGLVAGFNILTTLFISVNQKQKEISILKALGARNSSILTLFMKQSMIIGIIGSILGSILAVIISKIIARYDIVDIPDVFLLARLPIDMDWKLYTLTAISGILICFVAGLYPSWAATKVTPTEGFSGNR